MNRLLAVTVFFALLNSSCNRDDVFILTEAESFADRGGWVIDPQFTEQMGSPYLLAHGMGTPVKDAVTRVKIPRPGKYHIWVRTMNWAPGDWEAPGRFMLETGGTELNEVLGTIPGWNWQYAGAGMLKDTAVVLRLRDLTGFDGRCDAIYLSNRRNSPPADMETLRAWRKKLRNEPDVPAERYNFDVVIAGGGIAGCAASIAAAEQGLKVALIHDRPVLGGNASSEIRVHTEGITWKADRILSKLNTFWWPNGSPESEKDDKKRHGFVETYKNIVLFLNWRAFSANTLDDSITSVDACHTSTGLTARFHAPVYIDCTGDGWIGYWSGAELMYGREDSAKYGEGLPEHGNLWSPGSADNRVMGSSVLWRTFNSGKTVSFPEVPWAMEAAGNHSATSGTWKWEFSRNDLDQVEDAEFIRDYMLKAIYGSFFNAKKDPLNDSLALEWVSYLVGKRESRRLVGDYIYTFRDEKNMTEFPDAVVMEKRNIDVHYQLVETNSSKPGFLSEALYYNVDHYYIPYRCLYSRNIKNLLMAGRCFSSSHVGLGGPRVMNTTGQMGVAAGYAASLCVKHMTSPRGVYLYHLQELLNLIDNSSME
jgi:hypothetical protein